MRRRDFIGGIVGSAVWPIVAHAQQPDRMRRIGVLMGFAESDGEGQAFVAAFREGLQKLGWAEGRNVQIDIRWGGGRRCELPQIRGGILALAPDVIVTGASAATAAVQEATRTLPIVFVNVSDPVGAGYVANLAATSQGSLLSNTA